MVVTKVLESSLNSLQDPWAATVSRVRNSERWGWGGDRLRRNAMPAYSRWPRHIALHGDLNIPPLTLVSTPTTSNSAETNSLTKLLFQEMQGTRNQTIRRSVVPFIHACDRKLSCPQYFKKAWGQLYESALHLSGVLVGELFLYQRCHWFAPRVWLHFLSLLHARSTTGKEKPPNLPICWINRHKKQ